MTDIFRRFFVPQYLKFPRGGAALLQTMAGFEGLCSLPGCVCALDGTFMKMEMPHSAHAWGQ